MKTTTTTFLLLLLSYQLSAQENYWSAHTLIYFDNPITLNEPVQGFIEPVDNMGQFITLERNFHLTKGIGVLAGGAYGFNEVSIQDNTASCTERFSPLKYFGLYSGISYSRPIASDFYIQLTGRIGGFYPLQNSKVPVEQDIFVTSFCNNIDNYYEVNENNNLIGFFNPQLDLVYQLSMVPMRITVGLGAFLSKSNYIEGDINFNGFNNSSGQQIEFITTFSDQLKAVGLSFGLQYMIGQSS